MTPTASLLLLSLLLLGCSGPRPTPLPDINGLLRQNASSRRDPALAQRWLASLTHGPRWPSSQYISIM